MENVTYRFRDEQALITWKNVYIADYRTLMGYQVFFKKRY